MNAHTPGPWRWDFHPQRPGKVIALVDCALRDADVLLCTGSGEEAWGEIEKADRDLIEASPDLLASLRRLVGPNPGSDDRDAAMAAIAKAEGR